MLSRVAIEQRVTGVTPAEDPLAADISRLAQALHPDAVQLFYSVAVHSRGELTLAPDEYAGFIMACLRMLALNGEAGPQTALEAPAAPARQTANPPWPPPRLSRPRRPWLRRIRKRQRSKRRLRQPRRLSSRLNPLRPRSRRRPSRRKRPRPRPLPRNPACLRPATEESASVAPWFRPRRQGRPSLPPRPSPRRKACRLGKSCPMPRLPPYKLPGAAALAVTPAASAVTAPAPAQDEPDGPPSWVDEEIPYEAEGGFVPDSGFTSDPDDEFETLASAPSSAAPVRREAPPTRKRQSRARIADMTQASWPELAARLPVTGLAAELARQSEWVGVQGDAIVLRVAVKTLAESESRVRLQTVLCEHFGQGIRLDVDVGAVGDATAHAVAQAERAARQQAAEDAVAVDPFVQALVSDFGGQVVAGSVRHVDPPQRGGTFPITPLSSRNIAMMKGQLAGLMRQAQQMQENMKKAQDALAEIQVEGASGGGLVKVTMTCRHDVKRVAIDPSLLGDDKDMLEDLVAAAFNDALRKAEATSQEKMASVTAGMPMPPGMKFLLMSRAAPRTTD